MTFMRGKIAFLSVIIITIICILFGSCSSKKDIPDSNLISQSPVTEGKTKKEAASVEEIENAFIQSVQNNSIEYVEDYLFPQAHEILNYAKSKGEDNSALADLEIGIDEFYNDIDHPLGGRILISKEYMDLDAEDKESLYDSISTDLAEYDSSIALRDLHLTEFRYSSEKFDNSVTLLIIETDDGIYLLGFDW